jgi:excisionase family DNA binding protein
MAQINHRLRKVGLSVPEVMEATGLSRQSIYNEINDGRLRTFKVGRRRLVSPAALEDWVAALEREAAA